MGYFQTVDLVADYVAKKPSSAEGWRVFKSHAPPSDWLSGQLAAGTVKAVYSYRDLRDVAFSLVHKLSGSFEQIVEQQRILDGAIEADVYWQGRDGVVAQRYEAIFAEPADAIREIAAHLGIELAPGEAEELAREQSLEANRARTKKLADDLRAEGLDLTHPAHAFANTEGDLYHWNHIREGKVGGWKAEATPRQLAVLAVACGPWLVTRGYEPDNSWAEPALGYLAGVTAEGDGAKSNVVPWEVHYARMEIQATLHRQKCLLDDAAEEGTDPDTLAALETTFRAEVDGLRGAMQDKARELEDAQRAASHFRMCHDALIEERDFLRGQLDARDGEIRFLREHPITVPAAPPPLTVRSLLGRAYRKLRSARALAGQKLRGPIARKSNHATTRQSR